jgi:hypothetical protein
MSPTSLAHQIRLLASPRLSLASADSYLAKGEKDLARQYAEKASALLVSNTKESQARRAAVRDSAQQKLNQLASVPLRLTKALRTRAIMAGVRR